MSSAAESSTVKLISAEGHEFFVDRKCAMVSGTIKAMLAGRESMRVCMSREGTAVSVSVSVPISVQYSCRVDWVKWVAQ